jgi:hypothetical protein
MPQCIYSRQIEGGQPDPAPLGDGGSRAGFTNLSEATMSTGYDDVQKLLKDNMDTAMKSADVVGKGLQAIAAEATDYSKKSVEDGSRYFEKLVGAKSLDVVIEVQTEFLKKSYEGAVGQLTRFGEMYADLAKEMAKPYEGMVSRLQK